jgi:hypothetical protein
VSGGAPVGRQSNVRLVNMTTEVVFWVLLTKNKQQNPQNRGWQKSMSQRKIHPVAVTTFF